MRCLRALPIALLALLLLPALAAAKPAKEVEVQLLGLNDFHGHLESTTPGTIAPDPSSERDGTDRLGGAVDTDALEAYVAPSLTGVAIAPPALDRIDVTP